MHCATKPVETFLSRLRLPIDYLKLSETLIGIEIGDDEAASRVHQLEHLEGLSKITVDEARSLLLNHPEFMKATIQVLYEDDSYIIINKPFDVRIDVRKGGSKLFQSEVVVSEWLKKQDSEVYSQIRFCHQLDYATSGILIIAKSRVSARICQSLFASHKVIKTYEALVFGCPLWGSETIRIETLIVDMPGDPFRRMVVAEGSGEKAVTEAKVLEVGRLQHGVRKHQIVSKIRLRPLTGRRHQLRVHCCHVGHPIVGDAAYASDTSSYRMCLHATSIIVPLNLNLHSMVPLDIKCPSSFDRLFMGFETY